MPRRWSFLTRRRFLVSALAMILVASLLGMIPGTSAVSAAAKSSPPRVVEQTETSDVYANGDGTYKAVFYAGPVNFFDKSTKQWRKIDNELRKVASRIENGAGPIRVQLPSELSSTDAITVGKDDWSASLTFSDAKSKRPAKISDGKVRYDDVAPGISLEYRMLSNGLKEDIVLDQPLPAAHSGGFRFALSVTGATPVAVDGGTAVALQDAQGREVARIPRGTMTDANGADGVVDMRLSQERGTWFVDVVPDPAFLRSAERTYPIKVDPTLGTFGSDSYTNSLCGSCNYNGATFMKAGRMGTNEYYSYLRFPDVTAIRGKAVTAATLHVVKHYGDDPSNYGLTALRVHYPWDANTINWSNKAGHGPEQFHIGVNQDIYDFPITSWAQGWANGVDGEWIDNKWSPFGATINTAGDLGYYELYSSENSSNRPELQVTYTNQTPNAIDPNTLSPGNGWVGTSAPTLSARLSDNDDAEGAIEFEVAGFENFDAATTNGVATYWANLAPGMWSWRARGVDANSRGPWSSFRTFTITDSTLVSYGKLTTLDDLPTNGGQPINVNSVPFVDPSNPAATLGPPRSAALPEGQRPLHATLTGASTDDNYASQTSDPFQLAEICRQKSENQDDPIRKPTGWTIDHMRFCQVSAVHYENYHRQGNGVCPGDPSCVKVGEAWWRQTTVGLGTNGGSAGREFTVWLFTDRFEVNPAYDNVETGLVTVTSRCTFVKGSACNDAQPNSYTRTVPEWDNVALEFKHTSPQAGSFVDPAAPDYISMYDFRMVASMPGLDNQAQEFVHTFVRCDSASYLYGPGGCVFDNVISRFTLDAGDSRWSESARLIYDAQYRPSRTGPGFQDRWIPGAENSGKPLTRNKHNDTLRAQNHSTAVQECLKQDLEYTSKDHSCDEYPFQTTFEGASTSDNAWAARPITALHNSLAGSQLGTFYGNQRILHSNRVAGIEDPFWVVITNTVAIEQTFSAQSASNWGTDWVTTSNDGTRSATIQQQEGVLSVNGSSAGGTPQMTALTDSDNSFVFRFHDRNSRSYLRAMVRASGGSSTSLMPNGYRVELRTDSPTIKLQSRVAGTTTQIASFSYVQDENSHHLRIQAVGNRVRVKAWPVGTPEPLNWNLDVSDSSVTTEGVFQIFHNHDTGAHTASFDSLAISPMAGLPEAPPAALFADDWSLSNGSAWDTAKWDTSSNSAYRTVTVGDAQGWIHVNGSSARATALMTPVADSSATFSYRFENRGATSFLRATLRGSGASGSSQLPNGYRLEVRSDSPTVKLQKMVNGTVTTLGSFGYTMDTQRQRVRFEVVGSEVRVKLWADGQPEPPAWNLEVEDTGVSGAGVLQLAHSHTTGSRGVLVDAARIEAPQP